MSRKRGPRKAQEASYPFSDWIARSDYELLLKKGYTPVKAIGEGHERRAIRLRKVFLGSKTNQALECSKTYVGKFPKPDYGGSVVTFLNQRNGDQSVNEVNIALRIDHRNIARLHDCFKGKYGLVVIEEEVEGPNLADYVTKKGIRTREDYANILRQVLCGVEYLNLEQRILHRDIKTQNILVGKDGVVKLTDLQNSRNVYDIHWHELPTHGATASSAPELLNTLPPNEFGRADTNTECYALGVVMYEMATGKRPFDYRLVFDKDGTALIDDSCTPLMENGKPAKASLLVDGKPVNRIEKEQHQRTLEARLREVPQEFRSYTPLMRKSLQYDHHKRYSSVHELREDFDALENGLVRRALRAIKPHHDKIITGLIVPTILTSFAAGIKMANNIIPPKPLVYEVRSHPQILSPDGAMQLKYNIGRGMSSPSAFGVEVLGLELHSLQTAYKRRGEAWDPLRMTKEMDANIERYCALNLMNKRLYVSLLRSCLTNSKSGTPLEDRIQLPKEILESWRRGAQLYGTAFPTEPDQTGWIVIAGAWLQSSQFKKEYVPDMYAEYFCPRDELHFAQLAAKSRNYFATIEDDHGSVAEGYGKFLDSKKQKLINNAITWYAITDEAGRPHFDVDLSEVIANKGLAVK
jgi:serine/threonine protein kinase